LNYIGTSFGVTKELFSFWRKNGMVPIYLRQTANELTGEHTCVMVKPINCAQNEVHSIEEETWVSSYFLDFKKRMLNLLGFEFRALPCSLAFHFIGEKN
jgi:N-acetyltransferase 10